MKKSNTTVRLESDKELWKLPYYHGLLPREDVITMLKNNGDFMVRKSEETAGDERCVVLSTRVNGKNKHFIARQRESGRISIDWKQDPKGFRRIKDMVETHMHNRTSICFNQDVILVRGVPKEDWELDHAMVTTGKKLGAGAFGVVRRGVLRKDGNDTNVAIKEATLEKCTKEQIKEFMNEARLMRRFNHQNVIFFHGVAVGQEPLMIVMELATDGALKDYLQRTKRSPQSKFYMCLGAASGLTHIHQQNIIHCDIAARNCLFSEQKVKIADFGLSRELQSNDDHILLDKNQRLPIKWLAPETLLERQCSKKSDVWSFGILCWEIYHNSDVPYSQMKSNNEIAAKVLQGERLQFCEDASPTFVNFITENIWTGKPKERLSMPKALQWMESKKDQMLKEVSQHGRSERGLLGHSSKK